MKGGQGYFPVPLSAKECSQVIYKQFLRNYLLVPDKEGDVIFTK